MPPLPHRRFATMLAARHASSTSAADRLLQALGVDPAFTESVLGDLAEELAARTERDGRLGALLWYLREALRTAPHLGRSWFRYARRHAPHRLAACAAALVLTPTILWLVLSLRAGPPARLVPDGGNGVGGIVVNSRYPIRLPLHVFDAAGHLLTAAGVRFAWASGVPARVSSAGVMTCTRRGDATIRASFRVLTTDFRVLCRPVEKLLPAEPEMSFLLGEPARPIAFSALDAKGRAVSPIAGVLRARDTTVAALIATSTGYVVQPRRPGATIIDAWVGDFGTAIPVHVYAPVPTLNRVDPNQRHVAFAVQLPVGEVGRWHLVRGRYVVSVLPGDAGGPTPQLTILGGSCTTILAGERYACTIERDGWIIASAPPRARATARGYVAVDGSDYP